MNGELAPLGAIELARELSFELGGVQVRPSTREVAIGDLIQVLEPRVMQVLAALARRRGTVVSREELFACCWGGRTVGEESINRCIGAIRRLAETCGGFSVTTIPRVGYRLDASAGAASPDRSEPTPHRSAEPLLAVLAFDNLSGDPQMNFFSDGVSEEIQQTVARAADLKVVGRTSSFQLRGPDKDIRRLALELNATHVLDGSVRRSGDKVRIAVQLIDCGSQTTLWSDRFDRDLSDVFALQDEIAGAVAAALKVAFALPSAKGAVDPVIHDLFLRALARVSLFDPEVLVQTIRMAERVVAAAPTYARAWSFLAACRGSLLLYHRAAARQFGTSRESVREAAETALRLDPGLGVPYIALSLLEAWAQFGKREALLRRALDVASHDSRILAFAARFSNDAGRRREAADFAERAYFLDPLDVDAVWAYLTFRVGYDRDLWESFIERWPESEPIAFDAIAHAAAAQDWEGFDSFVAASRHRVATDPNFRGLVWHGRNMRAPYPQSIARTFERTREELGRTGTAPLNTLASFAALGMKEEVYDLIDQASFAHVFDETGPAPSGIFSPAVIFSHPMMDDIRFVGLCAKLGLCAYWVETDRWPDCADEGVLPYDLKAECRRQAAADVR